MDPGRFELAVRFQKYPIELLAKFRADAEMAA
jgi:hypothetical protein